MATWSFSVAGLSGGWTAWGADTDYELRAAVLAGLQAAGVTVSTFTLDIGDDLTARVLHNSFPYRAAVVVTSGILTSSAQAGERVLTAFRNASGGNEPVLSDLSAGESPQPEPPSYVRTIGGMAAEVVKQATFPLALVALLAVAVAVVVVKR